MCARFVTEPGRSNEGARKRFENMADTNFVKRHRAGVSRPTPSVATEPDGGAKLARPVRRCIERSRGAVRRWPLPVRLLGVVCLFMLGWFLLMMPLYLAR